MNEAISRKKEAHVAMCRNRTMENKMKDKCMKNKAKKAVSKAMKEKAEVELTDLKRCPCLD